MALRRTNREWVEEEDIEREENESSDDDEEESSDDERKEVESRDDDEIEEEKSSDDNREEEESSDDEEKMERKEDSSGDDEREKEAYKRCINIMKNPIEVEFYRTSDESKIDWQTKQQMGEYGLLGGCCRKGDHFNDKTHKCRRRSCSPRATIECRARSLSRPSRDKTRKSLHGILKRNHSKPPVRSRSVCFSEKNEEFSVEFDYDSEEEEEDISEYGLLSGEVARPDTEIIFQPSFKNIAELNRNEKNKLNINEYRARRRNKECEENFHGFREEDITNEMAQLTLRTLIIQMENKDESAREEFAEDYYDVIMETTLGDYSDGLFDAETHADVQNNSILEKNKSYVIPQINSTSIEENLVEANGGSFLGTDTLMEIQETNLALNDNPTQSHSNEATQKEQFSEDVKIANFKISRLLVNKLKLNRNCEISQAEYVTVDGNYPIAKTSVLIKQGAGIDPSSLSLVDVGSTDTNFNPIPSLLIKQEPGVDSSSPEIVPVVGVGSTDNNSNIILKTSLLIKQEPGVDYSPLKIVPLVCVGSTDTIGESLNAETTPSHISGETPSHIPGETPSHIPGETPSHVPGETPSHVPGEPPSHAPGEISSHAPGEQPCTTAASTKSPNACVTCSTCSSIFLSASIGLEQTLQNSSQWQCQDCAICILCFVRTEGDGLLMCCKCGRYYHKPCVMMEEHLCNQFICKFCTPEEDAI